MNQKDIRKNEEIEIDLKRVASAVLSKAWLVMLCAVVGAVLALLITVFAITPQYQSSTMFYVNNNAISVGDVSLSSITSSDITASKNLVNSYIVILKSRESLNEVIDYAGVNRTYTELKEMVRAESVDATEIFEVIVTSPDPQEAEKIASAIAYILPKRISSIIEGTSAKIVDSAVVAVKPSSPSYTKNTLIGLALGFMLMVLILALREIFDISIRSEEDIEGCCRYPVLAAVPDMTLAGKGGYDYKYDRAKPERLSGGQNRKPVLIGGDISFAAAESYKLLRTKLQFSFADAGESRVIGVSSALSGEGKSLSSINLAYTLSQLGRKVLLVDCDMRRPTVAEKLGIQKKPGLSSFLTGQSTLEGLVQYCGIAEDEKAFHVIAAGQNPPNPTELLSSVRIAKMLNSLRKMYDYVILDLPPVGEVSDAMAVSKVVDGYLLVVRHDYCDRQTLSDTVRQFEFVDAKILGVVYNGTQESAGRYGNRYNKKYKKYYNTRKTGKEPAVTAKGQEGKNERNC